MTPKEKIIEIITTFSHELHPGEYTTYSKDLSLIGDAVVILFGEMTGQDYKNLTEKQEEIE
jgi:hypothetical protein